MWPALTLPGPPCSLRAVEPEARSRAPREDHKVPALPPEARAAGRRAGVGFAALAAATFALIVLGALVRAHGAGLACPDWPLCFGSLVPSFDFRIGLEWGHRLLAGGVTLGLLGLSAYALRVPELRSRIGPVLAVCWILLAAQILLGGLTVLLGLAPWTVTAHLLFGNAFCAALLWESRNLFEATQVPELRRLRQVPGRGVAALALACALGLVLQLGLGGLVSSHYAGLACPSFPTCDGEAFVPTLRGLVGLQVLHRLGAALLLIALGALAWSARHSPWLARLATSALRLALLQVFLGVVNVWLRLPVEVTAIHSAVATLLVLVTTLIAREALRARGAGDAARQSPEELLETAVPLAAGRAG